MCYHSIYVVCSRGCIESNTSLLQLKIVTLSRYAYHMFTVQYNTGRVVVITLLLILRFCVLNKISTVVSFSSLCTKVESFQIII